MKKLPQIGLEKILLFSGFTLALTMAGFWHLRQNVHMAESLATFQQGISTCFARVTQTFTAAMIRDLRSPYLNKDFMALSDECLREGAKSSRVDLTAMPKAARLNNDLVSETYWFHEKVMKVMGATPLNAKEPMPMNGVSEKYAKIEGLKLDLADQLDIALGHARSASMRDEILMGGAFCMFMAALALLAMRRARAMRVLRDIERQALALLNTGNANVGAMVDQLLGRALNASELPVTLRVFRDYHGEVIENMATRATGRVVIDEAAPLESDATSAIAHSVPETAPATIELAAEVEAATPHSIDVRRLLINQATRMNISLDVQDGMAIADEEAVSQVIQSMGQRFAGWNANLTGKCQENLYVINIKAEGVCLNSTELEYASRVGAKVEGVDVNVVMAVDMAREVGLYLRINNTLGSDGSIAGSEAVLELPLLPNRSLTNVVRGKKRDLVGQLRN